MNRTFLLLTLLLALGACGASGGGESGADLDAARSEVTDAVPGITSVITAAIGGEPAAPTAAYGTCGTAPSWALRYEEIVVRRGRASVVELDEAAAALQAEGWAKESERALRNEVAASTWIRDGLKASLMLRRGELAWAVSGDCVQVDEDVANDLVGPVD